MKNIVKNYLYDRLHQGDGFVHKCEIEKYIMECGHLGDTGARVLRTLAHDAEIEVRHNGKNTTYRYIQKVFPQ